MTINSLKTNRYVAYGFGLVLLLLIAIIILSKYNEAVRERQVAEIEKYQSEYGAIGRMVHSSHLRAITLYEMTSLDDPFERDEAYLRFQKHGENMMKARDQLVHSNITEEEIRIWDDVRNTLNKGYAEQYDVVGLIEQNDIAEATKKIRAVVSPTRDHLQENLNALLAVKLGQLNQAKSDTRSVDHAIDVSIYLIGLACVMLAFMTIVNTRKTSKTESALAAQAGKMRLLYEAASQPHTSFDDQIEATLKVGCELFSLEIGKLCEIDPQQNTNTINNVILPENSNSILKKDMVLPLERTFCSITYSENRPLLLDNIAISEYKTYPCYEFANLGSYIATPIYVFGKKYGTINFSSFKAKSKPYTESDKELLYLIGKFASVIIETKHSQQMLIDKIAADDANKAKSRFLSSMSHELRTPLNAIIGYSELLREDCEIEDRAVLDDIERIKKSGLHLLYLVNNILDLSKIESGKMTVDNEKFCLDELLASVVDIVGHLVTDNHNKLTIENHLHDEDLYLDRQKIKQILLNLISNAAKFTNKGEISIRCEKIINADQEQLSIKVKDTGSGISENAQTSIFSEFVQDKSNFKRKHLGTGLGLSICKKFSELMGGEIGLISKEGEGSEFHVLIPLKPADRSQQPVVQAVS